MHRIRYSSPASPIAFVTVGSLHLLLAFLGGASAAGEPGEQPENGIRAIQKLQYEILLKAPKDHPTHDQRRRRFLAKRGVPAEQATYEKCREGARKYLESQLNASYEERLAATEAEDLGVKELGARWREFVRQELRLQELAGVAQVPLGAPPAARSQKATEKEEAYLGRLLASPLGDAGHVHKLLLLTLITPHTAKTLDRLIGWVDGIKEPSLKYALWERLLRDANPRARHVARERCLTGVVDEQLYFLLFACDACGSVEELGELLRRAPTGKAFETAVRRLPFERGQLAAAWGTPLVFDEGIPIQQRVMLARRVIKSRNVDTTFCRRILELPSSPESDELKLAILKAPGGAGYRTDESAVRECALSAEQSVAVRRMAIGYLSRHVKSWQESYPRWGPDRHQDPRMQAHLEALKRIAGATDEHPELRKAAAAGVVEPMTQVQYCELRLKRRLNRDFRANLMSKLQGIRTSKWPEQTKHVRGFDTRNAILRWDCETVRYQLRLHYAKIKEFAEAHDGRLPQTLEEIEPLPRLDGLPYVYFPVPSVEQLDPALILVVSPKALALHEGAKVLVAYADERFGLIDRTEYEKQAARRTERGQRVVTRCRDDIEPRLYVAMGNGRIGVVTRNYFNRVLPRNDEARKRVGAPAIPVEIFERLLDNPYEPGLPSTRGGK